MWQYEKKLQYPVKIARPNKILADMIIKNLGGADAELGASLRCLSQRYAMPIPEIKGLLTDIGTEELSHLEILGAIIFQLTRPLDDVREESEVFINESFGDYEMPISSLIFPTEKNILAYLQENLLSELKAHKNYDNILQLCDDPDVIDPLKFLRQREKVHYQRFSEAIGLINDKLDANDFYYFESSVQSEKSDA